MKLPSTKWLSGKVKKILSNWEAIEAYKAFPHSAKIWLPISGTNNHETTARVYPWQVI